MKRALLFCLMLVMTFSAGCWHWKRKPKQKEITAFATDVEETFKQRWMQKRTGELTAQGLRVDIARQQALDEFRDRYSYTRVVDK